ncbi:MAG: 2-deoxy-D-gluconate 3-dehydrogenase [Bacteroidota bacterium]
MKARNILITGGSAGMGLASAIKFATNGDNVIITGLVKKNFWL